MKKVLVVLKRALEVEQPLVNCFRWQFQALSCFQDYPLYQHPHRPESTIEQLEFDCEMLPDEVVLYSIHLPNSKAYHSQKKMINVQLGHQPSKAINMHRNVPQQQTNVTKEKKRKVGEMRRKKHRDSWKKN